MPNVTHSPTARLAARIRRRATRLLAAEPPVPPVSGKDWGDATPAHETPLALELVRRYALAQARRGTAPVDAAARRVCDAVGHALLAATGRRDPTAAARLWEEMKPEAVAAAGDFARFFARRLGLTADDLMQEAFVKFLAALPAFYPRRATFRTYYRRVARHHVLDLARRARSRPAVPPVESPADPPDTRHPDPADAAADEAKTRAVRAAVADVCARLVAEGESAERVEAFRLRRLGGLRLVEVAARVGRCVAWVYRADLAVARAFAARFRASYPGLVGEFGTVS